MEKQEIKKKMNEVVAKIKVNSKDQHYADALIDTLLSLKGQYDIEPTLVHIPSDDVVSKMEGETFRICLCKNGEAIYHMKGGMDIVVQPKANSLYQFLSDVATMQEQFDALDDESKELITQDIMASTYVLNIPFLAFGDLDFKYALANYIVNYLVGLQDKMLNEVELQDETPEENARFEEATMALENTLKELKDGEKTDVERV